MNGRFEDYLRTLPIKEKTVSDYLKDLKTVERHYGDADMLYGTGRITEVEGSLKMKPGFPEPLPITPKRESIPPYATPVMHYRAFRDALGANSFIASDFNETSDDERGFSGPAYSEGLEGILREARYLHRSRNRKLVDAARRRDKCTCQACGFLRVMDGRYLIDVHHLYPLGRAEGEVVTRVEDLVCLCPNCHRLAHSKSDAPFTLSELRCIVGTSQDRI